MKLYEQHRSLDVTTGDPAILELPFPPEALIHKVTAKQVGGTSVNFTLEIYNSAQGSRSSLHSSSSDSGEEWDDLNFVVLPAAQSANAGASVRYFPSPPAVFFNKDGDGPSRRESTLYVKITPASSPGSEGRWQICVAGEVSVPV